MGKIYEALNKSRKRTDPNDYDVLAIDEVEVMEDDPLKQFDFIRYSLGARALGDGQNNRREEVNSLARRARANPSREVTLDARRIDPRLVAFYANQPRMSDQYNKLALSLITKTVERPLKRILIASAEHGEGRSSTTLNLACALARARQRVLVVDSDLMRPSALRLLGIDCEMGLSEAYMRGLSAAGAVMRILPHGFDLLPNRTPADNPTELLASPLFWRMMKEFDLLYDFMLFDSSPLLATGDAQLLVRVTDTTLLVIQAGKTASAQLAKAIVPFRQEDLFGVVLNRAAQ